MQRRRAKRRRRARGRQRARVSPRGRPRRAAPPARSRSAAERANPRLDEQRAHGVGLVVSVLDEQPAALGDEPCRRPGDDRARCADSPSGAADERVHRLVAQVAFAQDAGRARATYGGLLTMTSNGALDREPVVPVGRRRTRRCERRARSAFSRASAKRRRRGIDGHDARGGPLVRDARARSRRSRCRGRARASAGRRGMRASAASTSVSVSGRGIEHARIDGEVEPPELAPCRRGRRPARRRAGARASAKNASSVGVHRATSVGSARRATRGRVPARVRQQHLRVDAARGRDCAQRDGAPVHASPVIGLTPPRPRSPRAARPGTPATAR